LRFVLRGRTALPELERLIDEALADPACPPVVSASVDVRQSTSVPERSSDEIKAAVHFFAEHGDRFARVAVLTTYGERFAITQLAEAFGDDDGLDVGVFTEEVDADLWLREGSSA
jgi:hypothetical protein